jgi:hypothetical protein
MPRVGCSQAREQVFGFVHRIEDAERNVTILSGRQKIFTKASRARRADEFSKRLSLLCR